MRFNYSNCYVCGGLSALLALGLFVMPALSLSDNTAFADDGVPGTVQIKKSDSNASPVTYKTYKLFNATVSKGKNAVTEVEYASNAAKIAVLNAVKTYNIEHPSDQLSFDERKTAQEAADLIVKNISSGDSGDTRSFAACLADAVKDGCSPLSGKDVVSGGPAVTLSDGYYLFTGLDSSVSGKVDTASSSPIFSVVGGDSVNIAEKTAIPTVSKEIMEDATNQYGPAADSTRGQAVSYRLVGTVSDNIASYDTYKYVFHDSLSRGMTANHDVKVMIDNKVISNDSYTVTYDNAGIESTGEYSSSSGITVTFNDLKKAKEDKNGTIVSINPNSTVVIEYTATLNKNSIDSGKGNPNQVYIEYSNNPQGTSTGKTMPAEARDYSYRIKFNKIDQSTKKNLSGAKFTIQNSAGKYLARDQYGTVIEQDKAYEWETSNNGILDIRGIDTDTYVVTETVAPASYKKVDPFTVTINATYNGTKLDKIEAEIGGDNHALISGGIAGGTLVTQENEIDVTIANAKIMQLPITGQSGIMILAIVGGILVIVSVGGYIRQYRVKCKQEQKEENK